MKNIIELYKLDIRRIVSNKAALFLAIALCIVPSLYALFNIAALWDPYGRTENLKIAVYSDDQKQTYDEKSIQLGSSIVKSLNNNKSINWINEESKESLVKGVESGKYYAGIYIPRTFTEDILGFTKGDIRKPKIEYYSNQKTNAIASKITDKASDSLVQTVSKNFIETVSSTVITEMNKAGVSLEGNIPMIRKASDLIFAFEENEDLIDGYANDMLVLKEKLPEINEKIDEANTIIKLFPEVNTASSKILEINMRMDDIERVGELLTSLGEKRDDLRNIQTDISRYNNMFDSLESTLNDGIVQSQNMLEVIESSENSIKRINDSSKELSSGLSDAAKFVTSLQSAFRSISSSVSSGISAIDMLNSSIASELEYLAERVSSDYFSDRDISSVKRGLRSMNDNLKRDIKIAKDMKDTLEKIESIIGENSGLTDIISRLDNNINILESILTVTEKINSNELITAEEIRSEILNLQVFISQLNEAAKSLTSLDIDNTLDEALSKITDLLNSSSDNIYSARELTPKIYGLLDSSKSSLTNIINLMKDFQRDLPLAKEKINNISELLGIGIEGVNTGIGKALNFYTVEFPIMKRGLNKVSDFIAFELPGIEKDIEREITDVNRALPKINSAVNLASDFIENDYPKMKEANRKIANFLRDDGNKIDLDDALKVLKADASKESEFLANPVTLVDKPLYAIPNYGSSSAPFYTALCLWVGALLLSSVTTTEVHPGDDLTQKVTERDMFFSRLFTFLTFGMLQALIVSIGELVILGIYTVHPLLFVLSSMFIGIVFMAIVYSLVKTFGNIGKGIAIIILVLSISAGGGNFPPELSGTFFRIMNPILPFTYAVNILRETVGGIYLPSYIKGVLILTLFGAVFIVLGALFHKSLSKKIGGFTDEAHESHFFN